MKKLLLTLIVSFALCGSIFAQYESHWPDFDNNNNIYEDQGGLVAAIIINGEPITTGYEGWDALEISAWVGDDCRANNIYLNDEFVLEFGDPYPVTWGDAVFYTTPGENLTFKMYDHSRGIEYAFVTALQYDEPLTLHTGEEHFEGWDNPDDVLSLSFIGGEPQPTTFTKTIEGVGEENWEGGKGGYYLIASPLADAVDPATEGMNMITDELGAEATPETSTYDLYWFNQEEDLEWQNYRASTFNLENGKGYLYASKEGTTITFTGTPYSGNGVIDLVYIEGKEFAGANLVGNPFSVAATPDRDYFVMNEERTDVMTTASSEPVPAMEGCFVFAQGEGETVTFSTGSKRENSLIAININRAGKVVDRAIVRFGEGRQLPKFQLNRNHTKVYIPQEGKDYAIVNASEMGEMPVSFNAEKNGSYTLSFNAEEVSFAYLHLIDNMTGNNVDLLETPSYSFDARTTDYANRFKLVFATGNANDDIFAFLSNGSFVINNEGNATVQVIDVNGRILSSETINGCANVNFKAAAGVYMLRLVNGDNVKVQKVVVR